ncbi:4-hydroxybenzoate polyprenyltransferase [Marmoricola sp. OAE513]|uniref:UbiA family prenyltransferase n=1 Tax=Marmoricola sp. OAE513 TaxID=2817894 RepID=UPI001AE4C0E5
MTESGTTQRRRQRITDLVRCTHPKQAVLAAAVMGVLASLTDRPARDVLVVIGAVLVVQLSLGLSNDLCDLKHDDRAQTPGKPLAAGLVDPSSASYWMMVLILLAVPLAVSSGVVAAIALLATLPIGWIHNRWLHRTPLSFLGWMLTFALYPAFLAYGGWAGGLHGSEPTWAVTLLAAGLGLCVHFITSLGDLVADNKSGARTLPLRTALRLGAPRLLFLTVVATAAALVGLVVAAASVGLRQ